MARKAKENCSSSICSALKERKIKKNKRSEKQRPAQRKRDGLSAKKSAAMAKICSQP